MRFSIKITALLTAGVITIGALGAACAPANEPQAKATTHQNVIDKGAKAAKPKPPPKPAADMESVSEANARGSAESYLDISAFSRKGLIEQLTSDAGEGFPMADAIYGVDAVHADWNEQAAESAKQYLDISSFSRSGLIQQLTSEAGEGFTQAQAEYGVSQAGL